MNATSQHSEDEKSAGISTALRRDARRIESAPFDPGLHGSVMRRIRSMSERGEPRFQWKLFPALAGGALAALVVAGLCTPFFIESPHHSLNPSRIEVGSFPHVAARASFWSYEAALAQGDAAFSETLDHDAQALLPASTTSLDLL